MRRQILPSPKNIEIKRPGNVLIFLAVSAFGGALDLPYVHVAPRPPPERKNHGHDLTATDLEWVV